MKNLVLISIIINLLSIVLWVYKNNPCLAALSGIALGLCIAKYIDIFMFDLFYSEK